MVKTSRPCDGCGADVPRTRPTGAISRFCSDDCKPRCPVVGCDGPVRKRGWCASHYAQWQRTGVEPQSFKWKWGQAEPRPFIARERRVLRLCQVEGCDLPHRSNGYCTKHETRLRRHGDVEHAERVWHDEQPCAVCGSEERTIKSRHLCSKRCERLYYSYAGDVPREGLCVQCGSTFSLLDLTPAGNRRKTSRAYCLACDGEGWRSECLSVHELAERDGTACGICGEVVDMTLRRPVSLRGPSIDHIRPRSRGGRNDPDNLQLAHLICNIRKSNRVP